MEHIRGDVIQLLSWQQSSICRRCAVELKCFSSAISASSAKLGDGIRWRETHDVLHFDTLYKPYIPQDDLNHERLEYCSYLSSNKINIYIYIYFKLQLFKHENNSSQQLALTLFKTTEGEVNHELPLASERLGRLYYHVWTYVSSSVCWAAITCVMRWHKLWRFKRIFVICKAVWVS